MKLSLLRKRYNLAIISFVLLSSLLGQPLFARPGEHGNDNNFTKITVRVISSNNTGGVLTCTSPSTNLTASTSASGTTTYSWTGPNSFTATGSSVTVNTAGTYTVTGTNSGKTGSASITVTSNTTPPPMLEPGNTGPLTCANPSVMLVMPFGSITGVTVSWAGPNGYTSTDAFPVVSVPGTYNLVVTYTATGCFTASPTTVVQDTNRPSSVITSSVPANGQLTCSNSSVVLTGSSTTSGVTYSWTGPNGFMASGASATVTGIGNYTVTVINPNNGCSTSVTVPTVTQNTTVPSAVNATVNDRLTCNTTSVKITGSSTTTGVTYAWTGPGGFTSNLKETFVSIGGDYTVTATDPSNGCSFSRQITVQADQVHPQGVTVSSDGSLSCSAGSVTLTGGSSTSGVGYTWTGPNGFFDPEQITSVVDSGTYVLTVNSPGNGCKTTASIVVTANFTGCSAAARKAANGHAATLDASGGSVSGLTYRVYPNPVSGIAVVELSVPASDHVSVEVYNGVGVREKILFDGNAEAGTPYRWTLNAGSLATGIHYCMIRTNNKAYVSKLLINR